MALRFTFILIIITWTGFLFGQNNDSKTKNCVLQLWGEDTTVYNVVDSMPEFPGSNDSTFSFIAKNLDHNKYKSLNGVINIHFFVETDGSLTNFFAGDTSIMGDNEQAFIAAVDVLKKMPKWNPGKCNGRKVRVFFSLPFQFP